MQEPALKEILETYVERKISSQKIDMGIKID